MASVTGTVELIKVDMPVGSQAYVVLNDQATNTKETFVLWKHSLREFTPLTVWIAEVSWLSLLRDAMINKLPVTVIGSSDVSARIISVRISPDSG